MSADAFEQFGPGLVEGLCGLEVAGGVRHGVQGLEGEPGAQDNFGQGPELLEGGHDVGIAVAPAELAAGIDVSGGEQAGAVEVEETATAHRGRRR